MEKYSMNKVEGFNPYDHIETAKDRHGAEIIKDDGTPLRYLSTAAKIYWFRQVYPKGILITEAMATDKPDYGEIIRYKSKVFFDKETPAAEFEAQETIWDMAEADTTVAKVQTIALGKALSKAGFGCEVELALGLSSEGEEPKTEEVRKPEGKKRGRPKKKTEEELTEEVNELLSAVEAAVEEPSEEESDESVIDKYLAMELVTTEEAPINIKKLEGKTLGDILAEHKDFGNLVKNRPNIRKGISDECAEALIYIEEHM